MKKNSKTFLYNFFIIIFIYLFIFSTNKVYANTYKIENIEISDEYNVNFNKDDIVDQAFKRAFKILLSKITISKDYKSINNQRIYDSKYLIFSFLCFGSKYKNI